MNTFSINFLNSFNYHHIYAMTITQNTQLQSQNQGKKKKIPTITKLQTKVQNPQIQ